MQAFPDRRGIVHYKNIFHDFPAAVSLQRVAMMLAKGKKKYRKMLILWVGK